MNVGETKVGVRPQICDVLERMAWDNDPSARVWRGGCF